MKIDGVSVSRPVPAGAEPDEGGPGASLSSMIAAKLVNAIPGLAGDAAESEVAADDSTGSRPEAAPPTFTSAAFRSSALLLALLTAACSAAIPAPPETRPAALTQKSDASAFSAGEYDPRWWRQFEDPILDQVVTTTLTANNDVKVAVARFQQSRAVFDEAARDQYPTVTVGASVEAREQVIPGFTSEPIRTQAYRAGFDAFWEIDLFRRVRSAIRAAAANADAFEAALQDVRVVVAAEVARNYFELRGLQQQLAVLERSLSNQRETLRLTEIRRDAGFGEEQDVASAAARVAAIEADVPPVRAALAAREHRIAVLMGGRPGELGVDLRPRAYPILAKTLPLGDTSSLLSRRPDVRAAERRLATAAARQGIARAELFPRITVIGALGFLAGRGNTFGAADSRAWAVTPALSWAAFDLGSAKARLRGAEAGTREAFAAYEQAVLLALEETENALVLYRERQQRLVRLAEQARESTRAANIARVRYKEGVADFLALLDAERTQLQAEDAVAQSESAVFTAIVGLYKALGGIPE
jgi:multidrug efflux system outer membrane protein